MCENNNQLSHLVVSFYTRKMLDGSHNISEYEAEFESQIRLCFCYDK